MRVLVIEDEADLLRALTRGLQKTGYVVDGAADGIEGLELTRINDYDLVVLDLNLPGMDGMEVLRGIREEDKALRVLILSARSDVSHRIAGLDEGANDYLVKPFDFGELMARIRSLLRRSFHQADVDIPFCGLCFNTSTRQVTANGTIVDLSPKELAILEYLVLNRDRAISTEELIEHVWAEDASLFSNAVKVHVSTLRKKLSPHASVEVITWVRGAGYRIVDLQGQLP